MIDLQRIAAAPVAHEPFSHFVVQDSLEAGALQSIGRDFPSIHKPGVFPLSELTYGERFAQLIDEIKSDAIEDLLSEKLDVELAGLPLMITIRGHCQKKDGRIHTDSTDKVVTCLLYLNEPWQQTGGRLRLLHNSHDLDNMIAEVPPDGGTLVAFKRSDNSWHGHHPFEGPRRYVMFNWVRSSAALGRNMRRHVLSARLKRLNPFG